MPIEEQHRRKRVRNYTLAGVLFALAILFFIVTIVKMSP